MKIFSLNDRKRISFLLLLLLSIPSLQIFMFPRSYFNRNNTVELNGLLPFSKQKEVSIQSQSLTFDGVKKLKNWNSIILKFDYNENGISDLFEEKLFSSQKSLNYKNSLIMKKDIELIFNNNKKSIEPIVRDQLSIIIQFPEGYNYSTTISLFKNNGGIIKSTYKDLINGFAGDINYEEFNHFYEQIKQKNIPFLIEENSKVKASLYTNSRNMRLRPYTWNTLGYKGDNDSSIAILDTGIDDTHEFFDNYSATGDFRYKIVGWRDETATAYLTPTDDEGHGSHCAGIAAGMGTPNDGSGRSVATSIFELDFSGEYFDDGLMGYVPLTAFNVTNPGVIEIECNFTDETLGSDNTYGMASLYYGENEVNNTEVFSTNWEKNFTYTVAANELGKYSLRIYLFFEDNDLDGYVLNSLSNFRAEIHWPFEPPRYGCGNPWSGVAPRTHLVGVKVLDENGDGATSDVLDGYQWIYNNRETYNITVISMSYGGSSLAAEINAINNLVDKGGIVCVAAAGNDDVGGNMIGSPGDADNAITVAAMNYRDQITDYSSQGGKSVISNTSKPDIAAPGGSFYDFPMYSADSDDVGEGDYSDEYKNDLNDAQGTSMATPAIAGAASLLITAMGGGNKWNWNDGTKAKLVKSLLLMTATETYPLKREVYSSYSPTLQRGGKDVHEGYGRVNIDAAIEAWIKKLNPVGQIFTIKPHLNTSSYNPAGPHAFARHVDLTKDQWYLFNVTVPSGMDYDLYLYNYTPTSWGEPVRVFSSISPQLGKDEIINYTATYTGRYFLVVKAIGIATSLEEDDDDDKKNEDNVISILDFLLSPLGLLIIGTCVAVVIVIIILAKRSGESGMKEKDRIRELMDESYY